MKELISQHPLVLIITAVFLLALAACTSGELQTTSKALVQAKIADVLLQSGEPQNVVLSTELTEGELNQILHAVESYQLVRTRWSEVVDDPAQVITNMATLETDFRNLAAEYASVKDIVERHWHEYSATQQVQLAQYHMRATELAESLQNLIALRDNRAALNTTLELGLTIAKILAV